MRRAVIPDRMDSYTTNVKPKPTIIMSKTIQKPKINNTWKNDIKDGKK